MDKKILLGVIAIVLAIGGGVTYLLASTSDKTAMQEMIEQQPLPSGNTTTSNMAVTEVPGKYIDYDKSALTTTPGTKLLFFHAPWCPQCRDLEADIERDGVPMGVTIFKVDYDTNQTLRQKYGVTLQTTIVRVDDNGEFVSKFVAYDDPSMDSIKKNIL